MKTSELNGLDKDSLGQKLKELREEQFKLKLQLGKRQLDNPMKLRTVRKDIAKALTLLNQNMLKETKKK